MLEGSLTRVEMKSIWRGKLSTSVPA